MRYTYLLLVGTLVLCSTTSLAQNGQERRENRMAIRQGKAIIAQDEEELEHFGQDMAQWQTAYANGDQSQWLQLAQHLGAAMELEVAQGREKHHWARQEVRESRREVRSERREVAWNWVDAQTSDHDRRDDRRDSRRDRRNLRDDRRDRRDDERDRDRIARRTAQQAELAEAFWKHSQAYPHSDEEQAALLEIAERFYKLMEQDAKANRQELREDRRENREDRRERRDDRQERREIIRGG